MRIPLRARVAAFTSNKRMVALVCCLLCLGLSMPLAGVLNSVSQSEFFGIPAGYFYTLYVAPILILIIMSLFVRIFEDVDRHDQRLENE